MPKESAKKKSNMESINSDIMFHIPWDLYKDSEFISHKNENQIYVTYNYIEKIILFKID